MAKKSGKSESAGKSKNAESAESIALMLNQQEAKILPMVVEGKSVDEIIKATKLGEEAVKRSLEFLANKALIKLSIEESEIVDLDFNGIVYLKNSLPERRLANALAESKDLEMELDEARKLMKDELAIAIGELKALAAIAVSQDKIKLLSKEAIINQFPAEKFLASLPKPLNKLSEEEKEVLEKLKRRKQIVKIIRKKEFVYEPLPLAKDVLEALKKIKVNLIEQVTPEIIASRAWKGGKFRHYDIKSKVPAVYGGKRHFVNQAIDYAKRIWIEMGFKEMTSSLTQAAFWNFDALFTPQDHPARDMHDTFYIKDVSAKLQEKIVERVKEAHEKGVQGSKGWRYRWNEEEAKKVILRTHTTALSAHTLAALSSLAKTKLKGKYFAVGKCFRNETVDWGHLFEFNQTEGIVIDTNANFRHLLGYLKIFFQKMGFGEVKFYPSYFPYTEPSLEVYGYNKARGEWMEIGGAGIFRPEVVVPLLGKYIPVLAWGPGFDRALMEYYGIKDIRQLYQNDITMLREIKFWIK